MHLRGVPPRPCLACNKPSPAAVPCPVPSLQTEYCGDGVVQPAKGEQCDDGNHDPYDGCDWCSIATSCTAVPAVYPILGGSCTAQVRAALTPAVPQAMYKGPCHAVRSTRFHDVPLVCQHSFVLVQTPGQCCL